MNIINRDFTLHKYEELCKTMIDFEYIPITVQDYLIETPASAWVIMRHDVDRKIDMALDMARLEHLYGIRATYYFRMNPEIFKPSIIMQIKDMGHEIGYHYEVLDKTKGNKKLAIKLFEKELEEMRNIAEIKTICMHGNPIASWSNSDLWSEYDFRNYGILGEPYLSLDYKKVIYFSDTGRTWKNRFSVKDIVKDNFSEVINSTDDIINLMKSNKYRHICILVHPNRWTNNAAFWVSELLWQNVKNIGKAIIKATS